MATSYSNPGGNGDRTASITVTGNFTPQGTFSNAVDGASANNSTDSFGFQAGVLTGNIITFDFGVGVAKVIDEFTWVQQTSTTQGTWKWSWSNDNSTYTDLTTGIAIAGASSTTVVSVTTVPAGARYYRLTQTAGNITSSPWIQEVTFKIDVGLSVLHAVAAQTIPAFAQTFTGKRLINAGVLSQTINAFSLSFTAVLSEAPTRHRWGVLNAGGRPRRAV